MGKLQVIVGGQYGSEGKGAIAGYLAKTELEPLMAVRVAGPNAGHTVYDERGNRFAFRHMPVAAVVDPNATLCLGPGSEVDYDVLWEEILLCQERGHLVTDRLFIDPQATLLDGDAHAAREQSLMFGTTGKGIGAARSDRIMRQADLVMAWDLHTLNLEDVPGLGWMHLRSGGTIQIEGTQGYGLGLHAGEYPHCTSSDCRAIDFMAMAGLSPWDQDVDELEIWIVLRTYPIRIAGNSGPLRGELSWGDLAKRTDGYIEPEYTTVTKKMRRVGEWDRALAFDAIQGNGGGGAPQVHVALTFADYVFPGLADATDPELPMGAKAWIDGIAQDLACKIELIGTGPQTVIDLR